MTGYEQGLGGLRAAVARAPVPAAALVAIALCAIYAAANVVLVTRQWEFDDVHAYLNAAARLQAGGALYISTPDPSDLYLYAPWFAFAWMPFTALPRLPVEAGWAVALVVGTLAAVWPLRRSLAGVALALLLGGLLYRTAGWGNVQPLIVAALVYALPTRAGPWVVGVTASLKPWAILAVPVYLWRREWRAVAIVLGVAAVLWLPALWFGIGSYPAGARLPNLYDATILLAAPGFLRRDR
jgi:hypothetical protein